jgi:hypothetical protein
VHSTAKPQFLRHHKIMFPASPVLTPLLHVLLHCLLFSASLALPQYEHAIPNGGAFGVLSGHSSSSGGIRYACMAFAARLFAHAFARVT